MMQQRLGWILGATMLATLPLQAQALTVADGTVFFEQTPQLVKAVTDLKSTHNRFARYTFVVNLPAGAGEPLKRITVEQTEGVEHIDFRLKRTRAYDDQRRELPVTARVNDQDQLVLDFAEAVRPGETITLKLRPKNNPDLSGVYLFGVTAFPEGTKVHGQFLGYGRLHFYSTGGRGRS